MATSRALYLPMDPIASLDSTAKVALLERIEKMARAKDPRVKQVMASLSGEYDVVLIARADGTRAADVRPLVRMGVTVIAEQTVGGEVRREVPPKSRGGCAAVRTRDGDRHRCISRTCNIHMQAAIICGNGSCTCPMVRLEWRLAFEVPFV